MKTRIAYIVTSGCYSDYGIHSVWEDRADAERVAAQLTRDNANVEEWPLNGHAIAERSAYRVSVRPDGAIYSVTREGPATSTEDTARQVRYPTEENNNWVAEVEAKDAKHAEKIAFDVIAQEKAKKEGVA